MAEEKKWDGVLESEREEYEEMVKASNAAKAKPAKAKPANKTEAKAGE